MADINITKIIVRRGASDDLPTALDSGEFGFAVDESRLFIGSQPSYGQPQYGRSEFPFQNVEILTENSVDLFAKMHGDRMREGGGRDYYEARLEPTTTWTAVRVFRDGSMEEIRIKDIASVSAFIDYAVANPMGAPIRMGNMQLTHFSDYEGEPQLVDNGMSRRDLSQTDPNNTDPYLVHSRVTFRFRVAGPLGGQYLVFQYRNYTNDTMTFRFKMSRPEAIFYDMEPIAEEDIYAPIVVPPEPPVDPNPPAVLRFINLDFESGTDGWNGILVVGTSFAESPNPHSGTQFAFAGENAYSTFHQTISVEHLGARIDSGRAKLTNFGVWHKSYAAQEDYGNAFVTFINAIGEETWTVPTPRNTIKDWEYLTTGDIDIPAGTRAIRIGTQSTRTQGTTNDNYWDDFDQPIIVFED